MKRHFFIKSLFSLYNNYLILLSLGIDSISGLDEGAESRDHQPEWFPVARMNYLRRFRFIFYFALLFT